MSRTEKFAQTHRMDRILASPEFQGLAPFVVAFVVLLLLRNLRATWSALAVTCGFLTIALLVNGITVTPLTGTRKIMLIGLCTAPLALVAAAALRGRTLAVIIALAAVLATVWVFWAVLSRKTGVDLALAGIGTVAYVAWLVSSFHTVAEQPLRAAAAGTALALGTGMSVLLSASALLGQLGLGLGAASGALLLGATFLRDVRPGTAFTLLAALTSGLLGCAGLLFAKLPWFALLPLILVPLVARVPVPEKLPRWLRGGVIFACAAMPAVVAVLLTIVAQEPASGY